MSTHKVVNIDRFKQDALENIDRLRALIENDELAGFAIATAYADGTAGNMWLSKDRPILLIGEMHCLMADMEFYEVDLRKHKDIENAY
jgi:formyltetrahydrofolate synthetase